MKRTYSKPDIVMESFQLDAAIAGGCSEPLNHAESTCVHESGYFGDAVVCFAPITEPNAEYDGICYHGPNGYDVFLTS